MTTTPAERNSKDTGYLFASQVSFTASVWMAALKASVSTSAIHIFKYI